MKVLINFVTVTCLFTLILVCQSVEAQQNQQNIAEEAYVIIEQYCLGCHGETGHFKDDLLIEYRSLLDNGMVIPGNPESSEFYKRLLPSTDPNKPQMPLGQPALPQTSIDTIERWITEGAPNWVTEQDVPFITTDAVFKVVKEHLEGLDAFDRPFARYFSLTHLYNAGVTPDTLNDYRNALSKLVNSLSWGINVVNPQPINEEKTLLYIDLRHYEWERGTNRWTQIEQEYDYNIEFDEETQKDLYDTLTSLRTEMECHVPIVHVDWFLANASLPPLYHEILDLPQNVSTLEAKLDVDVAVNLQTAPGVRVWRAGFNDSGVSSHNRVVERHTSRYGAYWKSYDFAGSVGTQNIFAHPLSFTHDGGEIIFNLPNGLQAYYLADAVGDRINVAPTNIVSNPAASDPAVRNGLSCIGCHTEGMREFEDTVRAAIDQADNPPYNKTQALRLYVEKSVMDALVKDDAKRYKEALEKTGGNIEDIEPVHRFHETFQGALDATHAAAAVGLETEDFLQKIREDTRLQSLGLLALTSEGGNVKRDAWTSNFGDVIAALYTPHDDPILPPDPDDDFIGVYIPDLNLRTAIERTLNMAPGAIITSADMKKLQIIEADEQGISDLRGLEFATNLERIEFRNNSISDLSPLKDLTQLNNIKLRGNQITDVTPLANLTRVDWLGLEGNQITDLSPLKNLKRLEGIGISGNPVEDVSSLAELTSLERIDAWRTPTKDFSMLKSLRRLSWIEYGNDKLITELPSLEGLESLTRLEIHGCSISDLSGLANLTQLEWLELVNNSIEGEALSDLKNLQNLTTLNLDANLISDVSGLSDLTNLKVLYLENNLIQDVSALSSLTNLERLDLRNNAITNFTPLKGLSENTFIRMAGNPGFPADGPKITGPWLWVIVPGNELAAGTDFLAKATAGAVTEIKVATNGAAAGKTVGDSTWTWHSLSASGGNNINEMTESLGWGTGSEIYDHIVYGSVVLDSPSEQHTKMLVGSDDAVKVWLNGELVHEAYGVRAAADYEDFFDVTLKQGKNVLLVALDNHGHGGFAGHFGFASDAKYTVFRAGTRFLFATDATSFEVGDTFTLHLQTENVKNLAGWQADLVFNPDVLEAVEVSEGDFLTSEDTETRFISGTIQNSTGKITGINALRLSSGGISGKGTLCSVSFTVIGPGESLLTLENFEAGSRLGSPIPSLPPEYLIVVEGEELPMPAWDVNQDGKVDTQDLVQVAEAITAGTDASAAPQADVNKDGTIDNRDLVIVAEHFGESTASAPSTVAIDKAGVTPVMVQEWIEQVQAVDDGSITFRKGIANLQKLLEILIVPKKSALLANYPNPFNPETWIPYHLSEPANVNLTIYAANGTVVRTLMLGHQAAGIYQSRSRAAYWDGKNALGEPVASGVYFYTLTAGDFSATRKMFIRK
ncbi:hypothetical protein C6501_03260 [Candidatus Poribacteria bacterium]|nr:MAG: hypothetical protein C6501_03260 [Candidatus Poribacteria bacterium]